MPACKASGQVDFLIPPMPHDPGVSRPQIDPAHGALPILVGFFVIVLAHPWIE
jgi:hypothetical protein